ncbi:MAG: cupin domain-containing protein, partial [Ignavibacteria bacterium]
IEYRKCERSIYIRKITEDMRILTKLFLLICVLISWTYSQDKPSGAIQFNPDQLKWIDAPPPLPAGAKISILEGNPKAEGIFTIRVQCPPYFKVPVHTHPKDERVTVISGSIYVGFGDKMDTTKADKFIAGSYYLNPANTTHYVFTQDEGCIFQVTGLGPWGIEYLNESEDKK